MKQPENEVRRLGDRRSFLKNGMVAGAATVGAGLMGTGSLARAQENDGDGPNSGALDKGDAAMLRLLAAAELIETDLWQQYNELGGVNGGSQPYIKALSVLDADMSQYISDNTDDEVSHADFLNAYLRMKGAEPVNLVPFQTLPSSKASGARQVGRLTNLMQLRVDTSWYTRYRSDKNPDFGASFPQAVPSLAVGSHPAIPRTDDDLGPSDHIQAIANTAGFHFAFIEQAGTSLYASLAPKATSALVLRILISIGGAEIQHFQTWQDKAGNAPALTDPKNPKLVFPDLNKAPYGGELYQTNLIFPEPCEFISKDLPKCSVIGPTNAQFAATRAVTGFRNDGLFNGQSREFMQFIFSLAEEADEAQRGFGHRGY